MISNPLRKTISSYTVQIIVDLEGAGNPTGAGKYGVGATVTVNANVSDGYQFVGWKNTYGVTVSNTPIYTFVVKEDTILTAMYVKLYTVSAVILPLGAGSVSGTGAFTYGTTVTLTANAGNGYTFDGWKDASGNVVSTALSYTFTVTEDVTLTAAYAQLYTVAAVILPQNAGSVSGTGSFVYGTQVTLTAAPNDGFSFEGWKDSSGNVLSDSLTYSFTVTQNVTLTAAFEAVCVVTVLVSLAGAGSPTGAGTYEKGSSVTVNAMANAGYIFTGWKDSSGSIVSTEAVYTFTVNSNTTLTAVYVGGRYCTVTVVDAAGALASVLGALGSLSVAGQTITTSPQQIIVNSESVAVSYTLSETPADKRALEAGVTGSSQQLTLGMLLESGDTASGNVNLGGGNLIVRFEEVFSVTILANLADAGAQSGAGYYVSGSSVTISATSNEGYQFNGWKDSTGAIVSTNSTYQFFISENVSLTADYTEGTVCTVIVTDDGSAVASLLNTYGALTVAGETITSSPQNVITQDESVSVQYTLSTALPTRRMLYLAGQSLGLLQDAGDSIDTQISIADNTQIELEFKRAYVVAVAPSIAGAGTVTGGGMYLAGQSVTVSASTEDGYEFTGWKNSAGETVSTNLEYTFTASKDESFIAQYTELFVVTITSNISGAGTQTGAGQYSSGSSVTVTASPISTYTFVGWQNEAGITVSTSTSYTFTISGSVTLKAVYKVKSLLPSGYTEFSYIYCTSKTALSSDGIGIPSRIGQNKYKLECKFDATDASTGTMVMGAICSGSYYYGSTSAANTRYVAAGVYVFIKTTGEIAFYVNNKINSTSSVSFLSTSLGQKTTGMFTLIIDMNTLKGAVNGTSFDIANNGWATSSSTNYPTDNQTFQVFCRSTMTRTTGAGISTKNDASPTSNLKLYYLKVYDSSGNLIHNYIPCKENSSNKVGLYDVPNSKFYGNTSYSGE